MPTGLKTPDLAGCAHHQQAACLFSLLSLVLDSSTPTHRHNTAPAQYVCMLLLQMNAVKLHEHHGQDTGKHAKRLSDVNMIMTALCNVCISPPHVLTSR